jgi:hypothetical protein
MMRFSCRCALSSPPPLATSDPGEVGAPIHAAVLALADELSGD